MEAEPGSGAEESASGSSGDFRLVEKQRCGASATHRKMPGSLEQAFWVAHGSALGEAVVLLVKLELVRLIRVVRDEAALDLIRLLRAHILHDLLREVCVHNYH